MIIDGATTTLINGYRFLPEMGAAAADDPRLAAGEAAQAAVAGLVAQLPAKQDRAERNAAGGYAGLELDGRLPGYRQRYGIIQDTACEGNDSRFTTLAADLATLGETKVARAGDTMTGALYAPEITGSQLTAEASLTLHFGADKGVFFASGQNVAQDAALFQWDNANKRLGLGVTPSTRLHVVSAAASTDTARFQGPSSGGNITHAVVNVYNSNGQRVVAIDGANSYPNDFGFLALQGYQSALGAIMGDVNFCDASASAPSDKRLALIRGYKESTNPASPAGGCLFQTRGGSFLNCLYMHNSSRVWVGNPVQGTQPAGSLQVSAINSSTIAVVAKGAASQSANLIETQNSSSTVLTYVNSAGNVGVRMGATGATAYLHLAAGATGAGTAPLKFTSGSLNTTAEAGAVEFLTDKVHVTITTGAARKEVTLNDAALTSGTIPIATTNGRLTNSPLTSTNLTSGTYTPTLTNVANLDASTAYGCQWSRVGSVVTVSGRVSVDPTLAATSTQLGLSLPVASNFTAAEQCAGAAFAPGVAGQGAAILADTANDRAQLQFVAGDVTNQDMYFSFTYIVL